MKAKSPIKARVVGPYNYHNVPTQHAKSFKKADRSIKIQQKNAAVTDDENKRITKIDWSAGADEPLTDLQRAAGELKMFKQAKLMTVEKAGWKHNPVRQDIDEAWGRFAGQEQR